MKKKNLKSRKAYTTFAACLAALLMITLMPLVVLAEGNVSYQGQADKFVFKPGSEESPTDLFPAFKELIPGDSVTDAIKVKNSSAEGKSVKLFMRATGAEEGSEDFLSQMKLSVNADDAEIFDAPSGATAGLSDWTPLGTLKPGGEVNLDVTISVPLEMGNEYQDAIGYLGWEFKVEEVDESVTKRTTTTTKTKSPKTADENNAYFWIAVMGAAVLLPLAGYAERKRRSNKS